MCFRGLYVCCPVCSKKLVIAKANSELEVRCHQCKALVHVTITQDKKVITQVDNEEKEKMNIAQ